jgi:serine protease Do
MNLLRQVLLLLLLAALSLAPAARGGEATPGGAGWSAVAARVVDGTVNIVVAKVIGSFEPDKNDTPDKPDTVGEQRRFIGSGFIVDPDGIVVTNRHVIQGALSITVRLHDGTELPAKLVAASPVIDLALLKIEAGHPLKALKLAPAGAVRIGDPVLAIGDPLGLGTSLSAGIVSGLQRDLMNTPFDDYVQTDAAINHGNSGGPLIDAAGEVVGANTILLTNQPGEGSNGLGFAISSTVIRAAVRHLLHPTLYPIGWIGVHLQEATPNLTAALGVPHSGGFVITGIDPASPAREAGLTAGDIILKYGAYTPPNARALMHAIALTPTGQTHQLLVWQHGALAQVSLVIRAWPEATVSLAEVVADPAAALPEPQNLGLLLSRIGPVARKAYKLGDRTGVLVVGVDRMSEAFSRGLRPGVVIEKVSGQPVTTPDAAVALMQAAAQRGPLVALLVRWDEGARWIVLHTGFQANKGLAREEPQPRASRARNRVGAALAPVDR